VGRGAFNKSGLLSPALSSCGEERENSNSDQAVVVSRCARVVSIGGQEGGSGFTGLALVG